MVWLDNRAPVMSIQRLIPKLVNYVRVIAVSFCHLLEERLGLLDVFVCIVVVPVDNDIYSVIDSCLDDCFDFLFFFFGICKVSVGIDCHRGPNDGAVPVIPKPFDDIGVIVLAFPLAPVQ